MHSHDPKEWERLVAPADAAKKKAKKGKLDSKVIGTSKKVKKMTLKELFSKGTIFIMKINIKMM